MIRDWTGSAKINKLSAHAERFFTRLIMKVDDFGNYPESLKLLNGSLFPDHDDIKESSISKWLKECVDAGVIERYSVEDKKYIHIPNFGQRLDKSKAKYPKPEGTVRESSGKVPGKKPAELELERELEIEKELEVETGSENYITIGERKIFDVLPILEVKEAALNARQKEHSLRSWKDMVPEWFRMNVQIDFNDEQHIFNSFSKYIINNGKIKNETSYVNGSPNKKQQHSRKLAETVVKTYSDVFNGGQDGRSDEASSVDD